MALKAVRALLMYTASAAAFSAQSAFTAGNAANRPRIVAVSNAPLAFSMGGIFLRQRHRALDNPVRKGISLQMRDRSSVDIEEGQWVRVTEDVISGGINMKGMQGQVVYAWEKCEVDPTCCCAELSMEDASVQVLFRATSDGGDVGAGSDGTKIAEVAEYSGPDFKAYFSPDELAVVTPTPQVTRST